MIVVLFVVLQVLLILSHVFKVKLEFDGLHNIFWTVVEFMYGKDITINDSTVHELILAARCFGVDSLEKVLFKASVLALNVLLLRRDGL